MKMHGNRTPARVWPRPAGTARSNASSSPRMHAVPPAFAVSVGSAFACALAFAHAPTSASAADGPIRWRLPTEVLGAGDAFTPTILGDADFSPFGTTSWPGPNFGERMAVTHLPTTDGTVGDVIVAVSLSGMSIRRNKSGAFEPYPLCDPQFGASRPTGAIAMLRLPSGGLRYELETIIVPSAEEIDIKTTYEECGPGCIAGTRLALSGRSMAAISGSTQGYAEARPAASRLRVHRRTDAGAWVEEPVRIQNGTWINAYDVDFVDEDTLVAIAADQQLNDYLSIPPREVHVFERVVAQGGGFEWASSVHYPDFAFSAYELGVGDHGTGDWPRIDAMLVGADDLADGAGIRIAVGAPGFTVESSSGNRETRGSVYRVHLPDLDVQPKGIATKSLLGQGRNNPGQAPMDRRVGHSVAIDAERIYFSAIGSGSALPPSPYEDRAADAIVAVAHTDESAWQANDDAGDGRVIITASMLPSPAPGVLPGVSQRLGIGFGRDIAVQNGGLVVRSEQYAYGISGGPVLAQRFEPVAGQTTWRRTDVYETGRPLVEETYGLSYGSLAVSETGLVLLGDPALGGGLTQDPGAAWIFSDASDSNGDGAPDVGHAEGVELIVIDEWSIDLSTGGIGSEVTSPIQRAIGISEYLRHAYSDSGSAVRVTCVRTAHFDVALQPAVMEYSSAMLSSHGYAHIVGNREISVDSATLPVPNCLRTGIGGYRPAHEAELLGDIAARWPWRAKNRVVLTLAHDCDQDAIPNLAIAAESGDVVSAIAFAAGGTDEHRSNLLTFLRAVDRAKTLTFPDDYDPQLANGSSGSCAVLPFIRPSLFSNGAFDPTLGYPRSGFEQALLWPDFNGDGGIDAADIAGLLGSWGTSSGDLDGDGLTGAPDLSAVLAMWGQLPAAPLPCPNEP